MSSLTIPRGGEKARGILMDLEDSQTDPKYKKNKINKGNEQKLYFAKRKSH